MTKFFDSIKNVHCINSICVCFPLIRKVTLILPTCNVTTVRGLGQNENERSWVQALCAFILGHQRGTKGKKTFTSTCNNQHIAKLRTHIYSHVNLVFIEAEFIAS